MDENDPEHMGWGYFTVSLPTVSGHAARFVLDSTFVRSSWGNTIVPYGVRAITFTPVPTSDVSGHGVFGTEGNGRVTFTLSNEQVTFDRGTRFSFTGNVRWVTGQGKEATLTGTGTWKGESGYAFEVSVVDNAPWGRLKDTIEVVVRDPAGAVVLTSFGPQLLKQGDIVVAPVDSG